MTPPTDVQLKSLIEGAVAGSKANSLAMETVRETVVLSLYFQFCEELRTYGDGWGISELDKRAAIAEAVGPDNPNLFADFAKHWNPRVEKLLPHHSYN